MSYRERLIALQAEWDESLHPRDDHGKFAGGAPDPEHFDPVDYKAFQEAHDTRAAVDRYVGGDASYTNGGLREEGRRARGLKTDGIYGARDIDKEEVRLLDAKIRSNPLPADTTLTRTVWGSVVKGLNVGDVYQDDGYVSTTKDPSVIDDIRLDIGVQDPSKQTTLTILAPKGLGHLDVNKELGPHDYDHQQEVILPRGSRFQVVSLGPRAMTVKVVS